MDPVKPRFKKNNATQALTRRDQVIISRLKMGLHPTYPWLPSGPLSLIHRLNVEIVVLG
jgi:hypothetical protein